MPAQFLVKPRIIEQFMQCERLRSKLLFVTETGCRISFLWSFAFNHGSLSHILVQQLPVNSSSAVLFRSSSPSDEFDLSFYLIWVHVHLPITQFQ